jgi:hypothetical protein
VQLVGLLALAITVTSSVTLADDKTTRGLIENAAQSYAAGSYDDAIVQLEEARAIKETGRVIFLLGKSYAKAGRTQDAIRAYEQYVDRDDTEPVLLRKARQEVVELSRKLARAKPERKPDANSKQEPTAAGATTRPETGGEAVGGSPRTETPPQPEPPTKAEAAADPRRGSEPPIAEKPSDTPVERRAGRLEPSPAPAEAPNSPMATATEPAKPAAGIARPVGITLLAIGAAAIAAGAGVGVWASSTATDARASTDPVKKLELRDQALSRATVADITLGGGAAVTITGVVLLMLSTSSGGEN